MLKVEKFATCPTFRFKCTLIMKNIRIPTHPIHTTRLHQFGIERIDHVNHYNPGQHHRHDYYEIFLFREGGGFHQIDFEKVSIENNSVHFVRPGQVHLLNRAPDSSGFVLLFDDDFLALAPDNNQQLIQRLLHCNHIKCQTLLLEQTDFELVMRDLESMLIEFEGHAPQRWSILKAYLSILLFRCQQWTNEATPSAVILPLFAQLKVLIEQHYRHLHQVNDYAALLHVTPRQLNASSQKHAGCNVARLIQERIITEAKRLLAFSDKPVGEIAEYLGFDDMPHFSKYFKKHAGMSSSEWRQKQ